MPGTNQFLPFAAGAGANTLTPAAYAALTALLSGGFQSGVAPSAQFNTALRQATTAAAGLAQFIADQGPNVNDDGSPENFAAALSAALTSVFAAQASSALSFSGLALSATGSSANVSITANELLLRTAAGAPLLASNIALTLNTAGSGANGLDTGTLATSTWYSVWVIYNPTTSAAAGLLSLSGSSPTLPSGYTHRARVGWIRTDGTANKFPVGFTQFGRRSDYAPSAGTNLAAYPTLFSGATSGAASLVNFIPPTAGVVRGLVQYSATNTASISSETGAQLYIFDSGTGPAALRSPFEVITRTRAIVVGSSGAAAGLVVGWEDNL